MEKRMHGGAIKHIYQRARELRNNTTHAETLLWGFLKTKPHDLKSRRQHPYSIFILDFYCHSLKLVIEVDGSIHNQPDVKINDRQRQELLEKDGITVLRFTNVQVEKSIEEVQKVIENFIFLNKHGKQLQ
jgi:imidazole glycerol-phosphate synthase subunit HisF